MAQVPGGRRSARVTRGIFPRRYRGEIQEPVKKRKRAEQSCWLFQLPDDVWALVRDLAGADNAVRFALACQQALDFAKSPSFWQLFQQPRFNFQHPPHQTVLHFLVRACLRASWSIREIQTSWQYYTDKRGWTDYKRCGLDKVTVGTLILLGKPTYNQRSEFAEAKVLDDLGRVDKLLAGGTDNICRHLHSAVSTRQLKVLELARQYITDTSLEALRDLPELHTLRLDHCPDLTDRALACLAQVPRLAELSLKSCDGINGSGLRNLQITKLTFATYERATNLVQQLPSLTKLQQLDLLQYYALTIVDLDILCELKLSSLRLKLVDFASDEVLHRLAGQAGLQALCCRACPDLTDRGLAALQRCPAFEQLYLEGCGQLTDLSVLSTFPALRGLHLSDWNATSLPAGLPLCRRLRELRLGYYEITDAIIDELTLCSLQELELRSCTFDVTRLNFGPALRELRIKFSVLPPEEALAELRQARPDLRVVTVGFGSGLSPYSWDET